MDTENVQEIVKRAHNAGVKKGHLLLQAEDYREAAEKAHNEANRLAGKGLHNLAEEAATEHEYYTGLAADFRAAASLM